MLRLILAATTTLSLTGCQQDDPFTQIGYFKDDARNRVFILHADNATSEQAEAAARSKMVTAGQFTQVYLFLGTPAPSDIATLAPGYLAANDAIHDMRSPRFRWRLIAQPSGATIFVDCSSEAADDLC